MDFINTIKIWWSSLEMVTNSYLIQVGIGVLVGLTALLFIFLILAPFVTAFSGKKEWLIDDPNKEHKLALFANPEPGETNVKMRNGRVMGFIRGGETPEYGVFLYPWTWDQFYCYQFGLYLIGIPGLQTLYSYWLPRLISHEEIEAGVKHEVFEQKKDKSNHVRTRMFTFYFVVSGAEIETVPVRVEGSLQARITPGGEYKALFNTQEWNVLLTQAVNSVIPGILKSTVTLSDIIGSIPQNLWGTPASTLDVNKDVSNTIFEALLAYTVKIGTERYTLKQIASIEPMSVDVTNFIPEISDEELRQLRSPIIGRQQGRARDLEGQGVAAAQKASVEVIQEAGPTGLAVLEADAFVRASEAGKVDALLAGLVNKFMPTKPKGKE
jgi:hypothetical protein